MKNATEAALATAAAVAVTAAVAVGVRARLRRRRAGNGENGSSANGRPRCPLGDLVRQNIKELTPYRCARDDYSEGILLDANENSLGPSLPNDAALLDVTPLALNRYPDPYQLEVKRLLAALRDVRPEQIFVGVGSDEAIDLLFRIFCEPGVDNVVITPPTYGMYKVCAKVNDVEVRTAPLTPSFEVVVADVLAAATLRTKLLFLCSPGNPTGVKIPLSVVRAVFAGGYRGVVVVDEAYIDFADGGGGGEGARAEGEAEGSACALVDEFDRLVVLQTLSKAWGLAAIRVGMAFASEAIIELMNNVKAPYNVNRLSEELARRALSRPDLCRRRVASVLAERERLRAALGALPFVRRVLPSDANFFLVELPDAHAVYKSMAEHGVVVRYRGAEVHCRDCLRVTVGTRAENDAFLALLKETVASFGAAAGGR